MSAKKKRFGATAAEIAAQAARETRSAARRSGVSPKVIREWKEGMTQEERERVIAEQKLTEEQVATLDATAHARALAEAAGDRTLTLEEEVVEINRQIEKLGEADEGEAVQMLDAELLAEEEAARAEEEARSESPKAAEETPQDGEGLPRAEVPEEAKPDAGGSESAAGRELEDLRVRAAELDERLRAKGLRKAERAKISEELSGVQARLHELSGGNLVLFSRGEAGAARPALSPTKAALRDRLLLKIARTAGIRVIREGTEQITASARNAEARGLSFKREAFPATAEERAGIEREAKGKGAWLKAPNGEPTNLTPEQWVTVRTRAFKEWFGDWENDAKNASKVVDENGEPLVVYHGTDADFTVFDRAKARATMDIQGNFFSPWEDDARGYGSNVRRFFLNLRNPADENTGYHSLHEFEGQNGAGVKARERLVALGYDGVNNDGEEFIAFSPEQIKSATENVGTFDAGNPDIRYSRKTLKHGSPHMFAAEEGAPFGRFRDDKMGTGEGAQAFGWGHYLTNREGIARDNYAQRLGDDDTAAAQRALGRFGLAWATFHADELAACLSFSDFKRELRAAAWSLEEDLAEEGTMTAEEPASNKASIREATKTREAFDALLSAMLATQDYFYESRREDIERALEEAGDGRKAKALREELERFDELKREADANERPRHHLYTAEIETGEDDANLLDWVSRPSEEQLERIRAGLRKRGVSEEAAARLTETGNFGEIYRGVSEELGGDAKASEMLRAAGFAGHKYPADSAGTGVADYSRGTNYVIYSGEDIAITDAVRWLRDGEGVVYGYWDEARGELHLNEDFADFDTPLHEWAHVWLSWVRKNDARVAERALALTKETKFYKELRADEEGAYSGLSDDALAEEAFAMLCGKDGGEIMAQEGVSTWTKLRRAVLNVFKAALRTLGVSESVLSRLTFRDMQSLCLRDLLDEETFSLKELRASVSAKRALEDAASEAVIDNGIEEAARKRAIRSASVAAAGKLLMRRDRMSREQVESAETLALLEEAVGRMLPTEPADVVKAAARAARTAAKVVYSSRTKADAAVVDSLEAVREASRAGRGRVLFGRGCFCLQKAACARRL